MGSITPIAIKSIRITVVFTGNTIARYKLEVVELLGTLEAVSTAVVVGLSIVDCWLEVDICLLTAAEKIMQLYGGTSADKK